MNNNNFLQNIISHCQQNPKTIALPESHDPRIIQAAAHCLQNNSVKKIIFYSSKAEIEKHCQSLGLDLRQYDHKIEYIHLNERIEKTSQFIEEKLKARQKPTDKQQVQGLASQAIYQAGVDLATQKTQVVIAGATHTTGDIIRAGLMTIGLKENIKTVSGSFIMTRESEHKVYVYGDCGVVIDPSPSQLADIATSCVETWDKVAKPLYGPAKVAFLSFSTKGSAKHSMADKIISATSIYRQQNPDVICDGEFQFDAAFDEQIGRKKAPGNLVSGHANIFIFPNLDAGNIAYKITQRLGNFNAYGPILQGLKFPYSDLSRGSTVEDIVGSIYINSLRAT